jgi:hypothetical protein
MNSFIAHENYLRGKTPVITYESLQSNLWTIDDIRSQINMNGTDKPIAEQNLKEFEDRQIKNKEIIIEMVNKEEEQDGKFIHDISDIPKQPLQDIRGN